MKVQATVYLFQNIFFPQANSDFLDWPQLSFMIFIYLGYRNKWAHGYHSWKDRKPCLITPPWPLWPLAPPLGGRPYPHRRALHPAGWRQVLSGEASGTEAVTFGGQASSKEDSLGWKTGALSSNFMWILCGLTFFSQVVSVQCLGHLAREGVEVLNTEGSAWP